MGRTDRRQAKKTSHLKPYSGPPTSATAIIIIHAIVAVQRMGILAMSFAWYISNRNS